VNKLQPLPRIADLKNEIEDIKMLARSRGEKYIEIVALELHKKLGMPIRNHRMASCCNAMYAIMINERGDQVISAPPKGKGSTLTIRYYL
jgi:predicted methyltransferase